MKRYCGFQRRAERRSSPEQTDSPRLSTTDESACEFFNVLHRSQRAFRSCSRPAREQVQRHYAHRKARDLPEAFSFDRHCRPAPTSSANTKVRTKQLHSEPSAEIAHQQSLLAKLKQAILQEAIQGKLTADWRAAHPDVEPASQLLHHIQAEKARLIATKKLRPEKPLPKITPAEIPFEIPQGWEWCRYGGLCEYVTSGSRGWQQFYSDSGALFIRAQNIKTDKLLLDDKAFVDLPKKAEGTRARVLRNDILITITGGNLAKTAVVEDDFEEAYVSQHIALTRLVDTGLATWIHMALITDKGPRGTLLGYSRGDKPGLNLPNIRSVPIPLPPLAEQAEIVERVEALMTTCRALEAEIEHARTHAAHLLQAVLKEAFAPAS